MIGFLYMFSDHPKKLKSFTKALAKLRPLVKSNGWIEWALQPFSNVSTHTLNSFKDQYWSQYLFSFFLQKKMNPPPPPTWPLFAFDDNDTVDDDDDGDDEGSSIVYFVQFLSSLLSTLPLTFICTHLTILWIMEMVMMMMIDDWWWWWWWWWWGYC